MLSWNSPDVQVGNEAVALPSQVAANTLRALAIPDAHAPAHAPLWMKPQDKGFDLTLPMVHQRIQKAAFACLPGEDATSNGLAGGKAEAKEGD